MSIEDKLARAPEIKESFPKNEITFAYLKPRFGDLLPEVEKMLNEQGLEVIYHDRVRLTPEAVDFIYRQYKDAHFFEVMKDYLVNNDVVVLLIGGKKKEAQKILFGLKKEGGEDGLIRKKFKRDPMVSPEDFKLWEEGRHPRQHELTISLTQNNVIHTADTAEEALATLSMILGPKFQEMKKEGNLPAELWEIFDSDEEKKIN